MTLINPAAVSGHNDPPDMAKIVADQMSEAYANTLASVTDLLAEARTLPETVDDDAAMGTVSAVVKRINDAAKGAEAFRVKEKEPYLRGGNGVDSFFNSIKDRLTKTAGILHRRVDSYNQRKLAEERARREAEAREAAAKAAAERAEKERLDREASEAEEAARRARKQENIEARTDEANQARASAGVANVKTMMAEQVAEDAKVAAAKKSADMVRTRHDSGVLTTMKRVPHVEVVDRDKLDMKALWPFLKDDAILSALKTWAKIKNHRVPMDGAVIEMRDDTVIR